MPHIRLLSMPCLYSIWSPYSNRKRVVPPSKGHFHRSYDFITSDFMAFPRVLNVGTAAAMRSSADIFWELCGLLRAGIEETFERYRDWWNDALVNHVLRKPSIVCWFAHYYQGQTRLNGAECPARTIQILIILHHIHGT